MQSTITQERLQKLNEINGDLQHEDKIEEHPHEGLDDEEEDLDKVGELVHTKQ